MITPEEIRRKAERLYPNVLRAWLDGDEGVFPAVIRAGKRLDRGDPAGTIAAVRQLRDGSKQARGFGYTVQEREARLKVFGRNPRPERIVFETREDLLRLIGKQTEFTAFTSAVERLRAEFPVLDGWIRSNPKRLLARLGSVDGLRHVVRYLRDNPAPNMFARELPIPVHTKFIEQHKEILREWLDILLPPHAIDHGETKHFERRFGLRYLEPHICVRLLDPALRGELAFPCDELSIPLHTLGRFPVRDAEVFIVENKHNLFTMPQRQRGIAVEGGGDASVNLRYVGWIKTNAVTYWGDIDVEGFEALSTLRSVFPHVRSVLMDLRTLGDCAPLVLAGKARRPAMPAHLTADEQRTFERCREDNLRLEQEHIPQDYVLRRLCAS